MHVGEGMGFSVIQNQLYVLVSRDKSDFVQSLNCHHTPYTRCQPVTWPGRRGNLHCISFTTLFACKTVCEKAMENDTTDVHRIHRPASYHQFQFTLIDSGRCQLKLKELL